MLNGRFLVIDEDGSDFAAIKGLLSKEGVPVFHLNSAADFSPAIDFNPSFIFLSLANKNSIESIFTIKQHFKNLPIIVVADSGNNNLLPQAMEHGACEYINVKSAEQLSLQNIISIALSRNKYIAELEEGARDFESIKENSINAIFLNLQNGTILEANKGAEQMFGYTVEELRKIGRQGIVDLADPKLEKYLSTRAVEGKVRGEITGIRKNGEYFPCEFSSVIFRNSLGEERVSTIMLDISERKKSEEEKDILIRSTEESFSLIDKELSIVMYNNQFAQRYKAFFNKEVKRGDNIIDYVLPERREIVKEIYKKVLAGETLETEITVPGPDGINHVYLNRFKPAYDNNNNLYGVFVSSIDITARKKAQESLEASEKRFRSLIENSEDMIVLMDANREVTYVSPSFTKLLGYQPEEVLGKRPLHFTHPEDQQDALKLSTNALNTPGVKLNYRTKVVKKDGEYMHVEGTIINQLHVDGVNALVNNFIDVSAQKKAKDLLEASEIRYRTLFHLSPTPMFTYSDETFEFIEINKAALDFYGYTEEEMRALDVITIRPEYDQEKTRQNIERNRDNDFYQLHTIHEKRDGTIINVQVYNNKVVLDNKSLRLVQINDITPVIMMEEERERANNTLRQLNEQIQKRAEDLEASNTELRKIAWMQSHLVRAPLARILGLIDVLEEKDDELDFDVMLMKIKESSVELDNVIREIVSKTDVVNTGQ
ncbi:MAG: PAS domain S-box protein [Sphingobacteriales bacterium JAD_PAG50586_3]|nr:MAG: PAS domain S-box protein [Sphingobacteriales bacterium JAD_PAG50586_3]